MLNLLKSDADVTLVERELKREPVLSYRLLRFVNSASNGFQKSISSFRQAVVILGYHQLHRWLAVLLVTTVKGPARADVVRSSLVRASFMETLAMHQSITLTLADQCFIVGVFSRLDELLAQPLSTALAQLNLAPEIRHALLKREGMAGALLALAIQLENGDRAAVENSLAKMNTPFSLAEQSWAAAQAWADSLPL
ncbi:MAG TPA: HDOD domain-containing protein [Burkholderiales bacterium]|nr:HDOD domain-containing protein [Burkholderiales bacterium]